MVTSPSNSPPSLPSGSTCFLSLIRKYHSLYFSSDTNAEQHYFYHGVKIQRSRTFPSCFYPTCSGGLDRLLSQGAVSVSVCYPAFCSHPPTSSDVNWLYSLVSVFSVSLIPHQTCDLITWP